MKIKSSLFYFLLILPLLFQFNFANGKAIRPDAHAPISVMADHFHGSGDFMFSYRLMHMSMSGYVKDSKAISELQLEDNNNKMFATDMMMRMHMFGMMVGVTDFLTLMVVANLIENKMNMYSEMMGKHEMSRFGLGDGNISALVRIFDFQKKHFLHLQLGVGVPYNNFTNNDHPPHHGDEKLRSPYAMQLGGGTWSPVFSITYRGQSENFSWGLQPSTILRFNKNSEGWNYGNQYNIKTWFAGKLNDNFSSSLSLDFDYRDKINGSDRDLNLKTPSAYTENYGGFKMYFGYGMNFLLPLRFHEHSRFAFEFKIPLILNGNGVQMKEDYTFIFGMQYDFNLKLYQ